jgi:hypothetical protein
MGDVAVMRAGNRGLAGAREIGRVPRVALTRAEAASALGISVDSFERYVQPEVRVIRRGRMRLIPVGDLERWADENAALTLDRTVR